MSDNTPEEKPVSETANRYAKLDAARKAKAIIDKEYDDATREALGIGNNVDRPGLDDYPSDSYDEESGEMIETALELAAEPWSNDELRLRAIVFLTRSAIKVRENHVAQMDREQAREEARERAEAKGRR